MPLLTDSLDYDPARINPAKFKPLFDEDEVVHEIKYV